MDPRISNPVLSSLKIQNEDKIILIQENSYSDSNFIITHLLKQILHQKQRVCFLTLHNSFNHYQNIGKKLGYDLKQALRQGDVKVIDPLEDIIEKIGEKFEEKNLKDNVDILWCMCLTIEKEIRNLTSLPTYLIIDDLSHLLDLGIPIAHVVNFINYCINLTNNDAISVILNSHVSSENDKIIARTVRYVCDVFIEVLPLKTGKSSEVTGIMCIKKGIYENRYHFSAFDRGVKTFHPGETMYQLYK